MIIKGKFKTENNKELSFEYKTIDLGKTLGNSGDWFDNTFSVRSILTVNGKPIGEDYYNYVLTDEFQKMYKNSEITEINYLKLDKFDKNVYRINLTEFITSENDFEEWFVNGCDNLEKAVDDSMYVVDDYLTSADDIHTLTENCFEFSNGYHYLSQHNSVLDSVFDMFYSDYEYEKEKEIA